MLSDSIPNLNSIASPKKSAEFSIAEQFLQFQLDSKTTAMLPISEITEVLTIPLGKITPIPHMPNWVMGIYNWRGEVLWMVDLGHLLGFTPWSKQNLNPVAYTAIVLHSIYGNISNNQTDKKILGLVVSQIEDIEWCDPQLIESPPESSKLSGIDLFLRGYCSKLNSETLAVLESKAIITAMPQ